MNKEKIETLIHLKLSNEIDSEALELLHSWIDESQENKAFYESYLNLWSSLDIEDKPVDVEKAYQRFQAKTQAKERNYLSMIAVAASLLLVFSYFIFFNTDQSFQTELARTDLSLNDGSRVKLNRFSSIEYAFTNDERKITLHGEGFFEVEKDGRPFIVETKDARIKVLGTKFVVSEENGVTRVSVLEGKVLFQSNQNETKQIILTEKMQSYSSDFELNNSNFDSEISWISNRIIFTAMTVQEVVNQIEKEFHIKIIIDNESLRNKSISVSLKDTKLDDILNALATLIDAEVSLINNVYYLK